MPTLVDTPQPAPVALTGEISFFSCIAQQSADTQRTIWEAIHAASRIFQETQKTTEAQKVFSDFLSDSGMTIAPSYADRLTPEARQLLRDCVDAADILNRYAGLSYDLQGKMMLSSSLLCSWNVAETTNNPAAANYAALHHFADVVYQIIDGESPAEVEVAEGYNTEEFRQLQAAWNTVESVEKAFLIRQDTERHERQSEAARGIFENLKAQINAMPANEHLGAWESVREVVASELNRICGGGTNG